ncbi:MAG: 50S ribosomal protein L25 [Acidobacteria bacterium]|nr:50S ribosomal protein L25 [Acidobacteriota bacterium]
MEVSLQAETREGSGKGVARKLRAQGKVPAVLYGRGIQAVPVAVDGRAISQALHTEAGRNVLIDLEVGGETHLTLPREMQRDPVRGTLLHVDFLKIARDVAIEVEVPIHLTGDSPGVKEGGIVEHHLWNLSLRCLPTEVPERIAADVSSLGIGETLRVGAISVPPGVEVLTPPDEIIVTVVVPQKPEEAAPAAAAEGVAAEGAAPAGEAAAEGATES